MGSRVSLGEGNESPCMSHISLRQGNHRMFMHGHISLPMVLNLHMHKQFIVQCMIMKVEVQGSDYEL